MNANLLPSAVYCRLTLESTGDCSCCGERPAFPYTLSDGPAEGYVDTCAICAPKALIGAAVDGSITATPDQVDALAEAALLAATIR